MLYRFGEELFDREAGLLAAGLFVAFPPIVAAAHDARPYAFALLAATCATWMLVRWARRARTADLSLYVVAAAAMVYFQYLFGAVIVAHAVWLALPMRRKDVLRPRVEEALAAAGV